MTQKEFRNLQVGDIVRGRISGMAFIVTDNYGDRAVAVRVVELTNPCEWLLVRKYGDHDEMRNYH